MVKKKSQNPADATVITGSCLRFINDGKLASELGLLAGWHIEKSQQRREK